MMSACILSGTRHPVRRPPVPHAVFAGMLHASLVAIPLWLLILHGLGVV